MGSKLLFSVVLTTTHNKVTSSSFLVFLKDCVSKGDSDVTDISLTNKDSCRLPQPHPFLALDKCLAVSKHLSSCALCFSPSISPYSQV